jgi:hypothetical protein
MPVLINGNTPLKDIKRALHKGNYKMPIYSQDVHSDGRITYENFLRLERLPTAFLLLRVANSAVDHAGNLISIQDNDPRVRELAYEAVPAYSDGSYSTLYYLTMQAERDLFNIRLNRKIDANLVDLLRVVSK